MTVGAEGAYYSDGKDVVYQEAFPVKAVDTTAAGDTFTGFFLAAAMEGALGAEALRRGGESLIYRSVQRGCFRVCPDERRGRWSTEQQVIDSCGLLFYFCYMRKICLKKRKGFFRGDLL